MIQNIDMCDEFQILSPRLNVQDKPLKAQLIYRFRIETIVLQLFVEKRK